MASLFHDYEPTRKPRPVKPVCDNLPQTRQRVLLSGLDCLPGQQDLFDVDGASSPSAVAVVRGITRANLLESLFSHKGGQPRVHLARAVRKTRRTGMSMFNRGPRRGEPGWVD